MPAEFLTPITPPKPLQDNLAEWDSWGGAGVRHFIFPVTRKADLESHFQAACSGLAETVRQMESRWWKGTIDWDQLTIGSVENWTSQEFFGNQFDVKTGTLYLRGRTDSYLNAYFAPEEQENKDNARLFAPVQVSSNQESESGYAYAMVDPPYGLTKSNFFTTKRVSNEEIWASFSRLCDELWGDINAIQVFGWPTNCSNYFDAGHEWWGSNFWTVYSPTHDWIVTVLTSATD